MASHEYDIDYYMFDITKYYFHLLVAIGLY